MQPCWCSFSYDSSKRNMYVYPHPSHDHIFEVQTFSPGAHQSPKSRKLPAFLHTWRECGDIYHHNAGGWVYCYFRTQFEIKFNLVVSTHFHNETEPLHILVLNICFVFVSLFCLNLTVFMNLRTLVNALKQSTKYHT